jgi:hypothetical protein
MPELARDVLGNSARDLVLPMMMRSTQISSNARLHHRNATVTDRLVGQRELPVQSSLVYAARFSLVQKVA